MCSPSLEFCSLLREYARWHCRRVAIVGHVINLTLTREYISVNVKAAFSSFLVSWQLTTLPKLSVDVSDVFSHELSRKGLQ